MLRESSEFVLLSTEFRGEHKVFLMLDIPGVNR
jgi:hypothetical protein